jgi:tetratricopeptide (TPR) repeat protein
LYEAQENEPHFDRPPPAPFVELVTKAIAKTRSQRYQRMEDLLRALDACQAQERPEELKAVSLRKAEHLRQEVAAAKAEAEHYGARERARSFYGRGVSVEAQAEDLWKQQSYTQAAQMYSEAIQCFADARDLAYRETLREKTEVARTEAATARQQSDDAWKQAERAGARTRFAAAFATAQRLAEQGLEKEMLEEFPQALDCYRQARQQFFQLVQETVRQAERERAEGAKQKVTDTNTVAAAPTPRRSPQQRQEVQRQEIEGEKEWQAGAYGRAGELYEQAGQVHDRVQVEAESTPRTVISPPRQTTGQSVIGKGVGRAAMVLGTVVVSATVIWFVALRKESSVTLPPPKVKMLPPSASTPVSTTPKRAPTEFPLPSSPPVPEEKHTLPLVTKPDVTESLRLGQFFQDRGQYGEAIRELEEAKGRDPDNADIIAALKRVRSAKEAEDRLNRSR